MDRRQFLAAAGLSLSTAAAGCSAPAGEPPTREQQVRVAFSNDTDRTFLFTAVVVVEGFDGVELTYGGGETEAFPDAETVDDVPAASWERAVTFTPQGEHQRRQFRSSRGAGLSAEFEPTPPGSTVVTSVAEPSADPPMQSIGSGSCGEAEAARIELRVDADGLIHRSTTCASGD